MLSKSEKNMFYYLGLSLLVLIVLGVLFGVSSVKESFGGGKTSEQKACEDAGKVMAKKLVGHSRVLKWGDKPLRESIVNEIKDNCAANKHLNPASTQSQIEYIGKRYAIDAVGSRASASGDMHYSNLA